MYMFLNVAFVKDCTIYDGVECSTSPVNIIALKLDNLERKN